jgi:two-component system LytT family response regulator
MRAIIIDDEDVLHATNWKRLLEEFPKIEIVGEAANADEDGWWLKKRKSRFNFPRYSNAGKNGFELLKHLKVTAGSSFTTAYDEYALHLK